MGKGRGNTKEWRKLGHYGRRVLSIDRLVNHH